MHPRHKSCCGHGGSDALAVDPRFADDDFTQAAADERRVRTAHIHGISLVLTVLGGILFVGVVRKLFSNGR